MRDSESFDFETWSRLAQSDPDGFEARRLAAIESLIDSASPDQQRRLRGLQWQIDRIRGRSSNPLGVCVKSSELMWQKLLGADGLVEAMGRLHQPGPPPTSAAVLPLRGRDD